MGDECGESYERVVVGKKRQTSGHGAASDGAGPGRGRTGRNGGGRPQWPHILLLLPWARRLRGACHQSWNRLARISLPTTFL